MTLDRRPEQLAAAARLMPPFAGTATLDRLVALAARLLGVESASVVLPRAGGLDDVTIAAVGEPPHDARSLAVPLVDEAGVDYGTLCVASAEPRVWDDEDRRALADTAAAVHAELALSALTRRYDTDRARWELAVQASEVGTFDWDLVTGDLAWDDRLIDLYGYDRDDFDRSIASVQARVHPDDAELVRTSMAAAIEAVGPIHVVYRIVVPPGHVRWLEARGSALPGPDGRAVRLLGVSWDVTDQQAGEGRADRILAAMPLGYVALDDQWRYIHVNAEGARLSGKSAEELLGTVLWETFPDAVGSDFETRYRRVAATGRAETFEAYYPAPLNTWFEVRVTADVAGISVYFLDITARHEAQTRLALAAEHDRTVAQTLQSVLLTELPRSRHVQLVARYRTAADADEVGGDWYDAVVRPDGATTVIIGDVIGHDIGAAATMGQLRSMLRGLAHDSATDGREAAPSAVVGRLDRVACGLAVTPFTTLIYGRLSRHDGRTVFRWSNAGHPAPLLVEPGCVPRLLGGADVVLGVDPDSGRHDLEVELPPGATLLLYTDGLVERRHDPDDRAGADLIALVASCVHLSLTMFCDQLVRANTADTGDDIAVLALRVRP